MLNLKLKSIVVRNTRAVIAIEPAVKYSFV